MEQVKIYDYYSFGFNYTILLIDRKKSSNKVCFDDLERHINFIKTLDLRVSLSCIEMLTLDDDLEILKKLATNLETSSKDIDPALWDKIVEKLKKIDTALDGELNIKIAYLLDEKRFSNEILLNNINKLFSPKTFLLLSTIAQYDFEESGKCLAFDRYTACAFHALRGTEAVLKIYYEKILQIVAR